MQQQTHRQLKAVRPRESPKSKRESLKKAKIEKHVTVQGLRRSAEDVLRRLNVAGPVAEALMGHNARMRSHYSTVADHEVAEVGSKIVRAIGLLDEVKPSSEGVSEGVSAPLNKNAQSGFIPTERFYSD